MQHYNSANTRTNAKLIYTFLIVILTALYGLDSARAQDQMPQSSDTFATQLTKLLKSITGTSEPEQPQFHRTRIVIDLERSAEFEIFSLVNPNRVVLQLPAMRTRLPVVERQTPDTPKSLITDVKRGQSGANQMRIILNVATPVIVENAHVKQSPDGRGAQLSLDVVPTKVRKNFAQLQDQIKNGSGLGGVGLQPPVPRKAASPDTLSLHKHIIIIDPGHGGRDSGARKNGIQEKDVVLAFSLMLRDKLKATGRYEVRMTRSTDTFITLAGRREFAERHNAALFISVHADYAQSKARGATIYSLRRNVAMRLKRAAKKDVASNSLLSGKELSVLKASKAADDTDTLQNILEDLAIRDVEATEFQTNQFTETVIRHMGQSTQMRSRPHRTAAFRVLRTATMPAVLIELAYVSNRQDARRLQSTEWRDKVSTSIANAVDKYFVNVERLPM